MPHWQPFVIAVEDIDAYGPYPAEVERGHSRSHVREVARFTAVVVYDLMSKHAATASRAWDAITLTWDGADVITTSPGLLGPGTDGYEPPLSERTSPDEDARYRLPVDWNWTITTTS